MVQTLTVDECMKQIHQAKCNNRRTCKIKVMQVEYFDDKRPKIYLQTLDTQKVMKDLGFLPKKKEKEIFSEIRKAIIKKYS